MPTLQPSSDVNSGFAQHIRLERELVGPAPIVRRSTPVSSSRASAATCAARIPVVSPLVHHSKSPAERDRANNDDKRAARVGVAPVVVNAALPPSGARAVRRHHPGCSGWSTYGPPCPRAAAIGGSAVGSDWRSARVRRMPVEESASASFSARRGTPPPVRRSPFPKE